MTNKVCRNYKSGIIINSLSVHFPVVYFEEGKYQKVQLPDKITRKINTTTIPSFCKILRSTSWGNVTNEANPKIAFNNFVETIESVRDLAFPEIKVKPKPTKFRLNPWMSGGLKISQKRNLIC